MFKIHHVSFIVADTARALEFYQGVLGLEVDPRRPETYRGQGPRCQAEADRDGLAD